MNVGDVARDAKADDGSTIIAVYYRNAPIYAVYRSDERVRIQYADDPELQARQRSALAPTNPVRGEIDGLLDSLRGSSQAAFTSLAERFDRRIADALSVALENDVANASLLLDAVKRDAADERSSIARLEYLRVATATLAVALCLIGGLTFRHAYPTDIWVLWLAAATGAVGSFFSIAIEIRQRQIQTDARTRDNVADAILRIVVGVIAAVMLICLIQSRLVTSFALGDTGGKVGLGGNFTTPLVAVLGFIAGFIERLVPDLLAKALPGTAPVAEATPRLGGHVGTTASAIGLTPVAYTAPPPVAPLLALDAGHEDLVDACVEDVDLPPGEVTDDADLPATTGGVATVAAAATAGA